VSEVRSDETRLAEIERSVEKWQFSGRVEMTTTEARALIACAKSLADLRRSADLAIGVSTLIKLDWLTGGERR